MQSVQFGRRFVLNVGPGFEEAFKDIRPSGRAYWSDSPSQKSSRIDTFLAGQALGEDLIVLTDTREDDPPIKDLGRIRQIVEWLEQVGCITEEQGLALNKQALTDCFQRAEEMDRQNKSNRL